MASRMRSCSAENEKSILHHCGDFRVVEAELDQDFPRVLAKLRRARPDAPAPPAIGPHRELRIPALDGLPLLQVLKLLGFAGLEAEIERHVVLFEQPDPLLRGPSAHRLGKNPRKLVAVLAPRGITREGHAIQFRNQGYEVLPEVLLENPQS